MSKKSKKLEVKKDKRSLPDEEDGFELDLSIEAEEREIFDGDFSSKEPSLNLLNSSRGPVKDVYLNVSCKACGSKRGKPCVSKTGALKAGLNVHKARLDAIHHLNEVRRKAEELQELKKINDYWGAMDFSSGSSLAR